MDDSNVFKLKVYDALGDFKYSEEELQQVRDKIVNMRIGHASDVVSAISLLINNKINRNNHINDIPYVYKRIDKSILITKDIKVKWSYSNPIYYHCDHCGNNDKTHMIRKSKSLWVMICYPCVVKFIHAANKLKVYYLSRNMNYKLLLMQEFLIMDVINYIKTLLAYQCIDSFIKTI